MTFLAVDTLQSSSPANWPWLPLRRVMTLRRERNTQSRAILLAVSSDRGVEARPDDGGRQLPAEATIADYWLVKPGDIVFNPMWAIGGGVAASAISGAVSPAYRVYTPGPRILPRFAHYYLRCQKVVEQYALVVRGLTTFDRSVTREDFEMMPVPVPPLAVQHAIVAYLDTETTRIGAMLVTKRRMIDLLLERWLTVIEDACWNGVEGTAPLSRYITTIEQGWSPDCEGRPAEGDEWGVVKAGCVKSMTFDSNENKALPFHEIPRPHLAIRNGDLLVNRASGSPSLAGSVAIATVTSPRLMLCDKVFRLSVASDVSPDFLMYVLSSRKARSFIEPRLTGVPGTAYNLPASVLRSVPIPRLIVGEQWKLVTRLRATEQVIGRTRGTLSRQIQCLVEHRQALITAAIIGELEVPGVGV